MEQLSEISIPLISVVIITLVLFEWALLVIQQKVERNKETWVNLASAGLAFIPLFALTKFILVGLMFWIYQFRFFEIGQQWYFWILAWILYDFGFWLIHYLGHKVRIVWCLHNVHHSAKEMKLSVAFRGSFFDFLVVPHNIIWLPLLGFNPYMILIVDAIGKFYGFIVHVNKNWFPNRRRTWIEYLLISPSAHRVHHATNHLYLDRNFGETFCIWDRLFGTYQAELPSEVPHYGVMKPIDSEDLWDAQSHEIRSLWRDIRNAPGIVNKLKYVFYPPGWNHLDGGVLAKDLRKKASQQAGR